MHTYGISQKSFELIIEALNARSEVERAVLFGSRALGTARPGSDIDLAIYGINVNPRIASELSRELNERRPIPYKIDVLSYEHTDHQDLKRHIDAHGREIYSRGSSHSGQSGGQSGDGAQPPGN